MLKAWHLPVAPFIKEQQERLFITLWLSGDDLPQRVTLRAEEDNEELSLPMHRLRQEPHPGVVAWRGEINLASGQPRRRYSFKLLWADRQRWFTVFRRRDWNSSPSICRIAARSGWPIRSFIKFSLTVLRAARHEKRNRIGSIIITPPGAILSGNRGMSR